MFTCIGYQGLFRQCRLERQLGPVVDEGPSARLSGTSTPDPEAAALPKRRQFSAAYKRRIVREANACQVPGEVGALLRREGLYSSHLTTMPARWQTYGHQPVHEHRYHGVPAPTPPPCRRDRPQGPMAGICP
jgi:hypothetical protein